jgi:hypothetical protein
MNGERPRSSSTRPYNCDALRVSGYVCPKSPTVHAVAPGLWSNWLSDYTPAHKLVYTRFLLIPAARCEAGNDKIKSAARILHTLQQREDYAGTGRRGFSEGRQTIHRQQYRHAA